jgi:hypothetical protein
LSRKFLFGCTHSGIDDDIHNDSPLKSIEITL